MTRTTSPLRDPITRDARRCHSTPAAVQAPADWLPSAGQPIVASRAQQSRYIEAHKDSDWFLRLATEIEAYGDATQSKLLIKFYLFMRDFFPRGFVDQHAHIDGDDVMRHLLCHNEHFVSRHKVSRAAETAFGELEKWMKGFTTWQEALKLSKPSNSGRGKKSGWQAPGLHTPAGLLAVLILAYPDPEARFRTSIGRLEIDWMMQKREGLHVRSGFWKGLTESNVYTVFRAEEPRRADLEALADYKTLFANFVACQEDIRPYLPPWCKHITLTGAPDLNIHGGNRSEGVATSYKNIHSKNNSDGETNKGSDGVSMDRHSPTNSNDTAGTTSDTSKPTDSDAHATAQEVVRTALRRSHINPATKDLAVLQEWLIKTLRQDPAFGSWCRYWETQINAATNYQQQIIIRSLFRQSLQRIAVFSGKGPDAIGAAYRVLDTADGSRMPDDFPIEQNLRALRKGPYAVCEEANNELYALVEGSLSQTTKDTVQALFQQQAYFVSQLIRSAEYLSTAPKVMDLDAERTRVVIQELQRDQRHQHEAQFWLAKRDILLEKQVANSLQLTTWQQRAVLSGAVDVLTPEQAQHFRCNFCPELTSAEDADRDLSVYPAMEVTPGRLADDIHCQFPSLYKLFGSADQPPSSKAPEPIPIGTSSPSPAVHTAHSRLASPVKRKNTFAGQVHAPARSDGSLDGRPAKVPRLLGRADLAEQLVTLQSRVDAAPDHLAAFQAYVDSRFRISEEHLQATEARIKTGLQERLVKHNDDILQVLRTHQEVTAAQITELLSHTETQSRLCMEQARSTEAKLEARLEAQRLAGEALLQAVSKQHEELVKKLATQAQSMAKINETHGAFEAQRNKATVAASHLQEQVDKITVRQQESVDQITARHAQMADQLTGLQTQYAGLADRFSAQAETLSRLETILIAKNDASKARQCGEDGYLDEVCGAPAGQDQKEHNASLLRACWFYMDCLGSVEEGFSADEHALELTMERYPDLSEDHIVKTLDHLHVQFYRQPLRRG